MTSQPTTESPATVPRPRDASAATAKPHTAHTFREYWDLDRCAWVPCPTRAES